MKAFVLTLLTAMTFITADAYKFSYNFNDIPVSQAIIQISKDHPELNINLIYDELNSYRTSANVRTDDAYEALRRTVGLNPVTILKKRNGFYIEALQHGKYCYTGRAVGTDNEPVAAATVMLLAPKDSTVITYGITDEAGRFSIPCDRKGVIAKLSCIGYKTTYKKGDSFFLNTIIMPENTLTLQEVKVDVDNAALYTDRSVYIPSSKQKNAARNATDLLRLLSIPQIRIDPITESISDNFGGNVVVYINSLPASKDEMEGMRTADVKKVEFLEFPSDPRFRGASKVINIVMQEYAYGGYTKLTTKENFLTGLDSYANIFSKFSYGKMTYDLFVAANNSDHTHDGSNITGTYSLLNGNESFTVNRTETTDKSKFKQNQYPVTFRATYKSDKIQLRNTLGYHFYENPVRSRSGSLSYLPKITENTSFNSNSPQHNNSLSYSGSWFLSLPKNFSVDISPTFDYTHTNSLTEYSIDNSSEIIRNAREDAYDLRVDGYLRKKIGDRHSLMLGINGGRWYNNLIYTGNIDYKDRFSNAFAAGLVGYNYQTQKIAVNFDAGLMWENSTINGFSIDDLYPFTHLNVRYSLNNKNMFSVYFQYANNTAGITEKASDILQDNELMYISGNPDLKNSRHTTVNISYTWIPSNAFAISAYGRYFGLYNRMFRTYIHYNDGQALLRTWINDGDYLSGSMGIAARWTLLKGNLQLYANPEMRFNKITGTCPLISNPIDLRVQATYYLKHTYFQGMYQLPSKGLRFNTNTVTRQRDFYSITAGWSNADWNLSLAAYNLFNRGWENGRLECKTPLYSEGKTNLGNYYHSRINLTAIYTFGYGKKVKRGNEVGAQSGASSGIMKNE